MSDERLAEMFEYAKAQTARYPVSWNVDLELALRELQNRRAGEQ